MKRYLALALLAAGCSDTTSNAATQLNLDRPVDIAFACYGGLRLTGGGAATGSEEVISSAQPIESCNIRSGKRPEDDQSETPPPPGQEDLPGSPVNGPSYYGFILQSGPGTVALAQFATQPTYSFNDVEVIDIDPLTPGKNGITVGEDPVAIVTDRLGCYEVIANAGSCDLSILDVNSIFDGTAPGQDPIVNRMVVKNAAGTPVTARPAAMVVEAPGGTIGNACPATPTGIVYIAYPGCHAVAGVDVSTGTVVTAIQFDANGVPTVTDGNLTCPSECDGTGSVTSGFRPVALDLEYDTRSGRRILAIGADNSNLLTIYDLDAAYRPLTVQPQVALQNTNGRLGAISLSISPVIGMGGVSLSEPNDGSSVGAERQFVYAVTNDGTVRVADVTNVPRECDTQIDPRYLRSETNIDKLACLPIGDMTLPRRAGARGPGIELPGDSQALSTDFFRIQGSADGGPDLLIGYFAVITAANGLSFIVNVDDDVAADFVEVANPIGTQVPLVIAHQLRDNVNSRELLATRAGDDPPGNDPPPQLAVCDDPGPEVEANAGGNRLVGGITRTIPTNTLAEEKFGGLPSIRQVLCESEHPDSDTRPVSELYFSAPVDVRETVFPDLRAAQSDETWSLTWEGSLSLDTSSVAIDGPPVRESQMFVDGAGMRIVDNSKPFCDSGVEPYDVLQMRGCDPSLGDAGCPLGYTCYVHPQSQVAGLGSCMLEDEAERLANACKPFLTSLRRYTISRTKAGELLLEPRKHALRTTPTTGCVDDNQCKALADYAVRGPSTANPVDDRTAADTRQWSCQVDTSRRPEIGFDDGPLRRCLQVCDVETECTLGTVCTPHPDAVAVGHVGYCMEGVVPPQACVNAPQRYELRAGDAFAVVGSRSGYMHPIIADANGSCVKDPNANPLLVGRIPLRAPACDPAADPRTGRKMDGTYDANPCMATVDETEYQLNYVPDTCTLGTPDESIVTRPAEALRLRNRSLTLTLVDPTYQGDLRCHGDRAGTLDDVPLIAPGFQIAFRAIAGFRPMTISSIAPSFPVKVTRGPLNSIWVIDEGDYLSTSITQPSTRGKVYRVEAPAIGIANELK